MSASRQTAWYKHACALFILGLVAGPASAERGREAADSPLAEQGRHIYVQGILPDGSPLLARRPEGFVLEGRYAACVTCHRESGMGSTEGLLDSTVLVPPVAGPVLFAAARFHGSYLNRVHHWVPNAAWERAITRGAYDEASLARSLRDGLDPDGRALVAPMPRYDLDDEAVSALAAYLRRLSAEPAPGVAPDELHLATVVTPDAPAGRAEAVVGVLQAWSASSRAYGGAWDLQVWQLIGPPETWQAQLEEHYLQRPVFAVLSGAGGAEWTPVHRFCEENGIPCLLPVVDVAPDGDPGFYPVYFSPGVTLEARLLASHLNAERAGVRPTGEIVQVFAGATGRRAAEVAAASLPPGSTTLRRLRPTAPAAGLSDLPSDTVLVLWLRAADLAQLVEALPQGPPGPVYLSALLAPPEALALPPAWKVRATYLSLFDDLGVQGEIARLRLERWLQQVGLPRAEDPRVQADAYAACYLLAAAISEIRRQEIRRPPVPLTREHVLETLEKKVNKYTDGTDLVTQDSHVAQYGRMSLGPGQRTAVRGGVLLRFASPDSNELVPASDRIVP